MFFFLSCISKACLLASCSAQEEPGTPTHFIFSLAGAKSRFTPSGLRRLLKSTYFSRHRGVSSIWTGIANLMRTGENRALQQGGQETLHREVGSHGTGSETRRLLRKRGCRAFHPPTIHMWKNHLFSTNVAHVSSPFFRPLCRSWSLKMASCPTCSAILWSLVNNFVLCRGWERQSDFNISGLWHLGKELKSWEGHELRQSRDYLAVCWCSMNMCPKGRRRGRRGSNFSH